MKKIIPKASIHPINEKHKFTELVYLKHVKTGMISGTLESSSLFAKLLKCAMRNKYLYSSSKIKDPSRSGVLLVPDEVFALKKFFQTLSKGDKEILILIVSSTLMNIKANEDKLRLVDHLFQRVKANSMPLHHRIPEGDEAHHLSINPTIKIKDIIKKNKLAKKRIDQTVKFLDQYSTYFPDSHIERDEVADLAFRFEKVSLQIDQFKKNNLNEDKLLESAFYFYASTFISNCEGGVIKKHDIESKVEELQNLLLLQPIKLETIRKKIAQGHKDCKPQRIKNIFKSLNYKMGIGKS
jgi:hypothetical protein